MTIPMCLTVLGACAILARTLVSKGCIYDYDRIFLFVSLTERTG